MVTMYIKKKKTHSCTFKLDGGVFQIVIVSVKQLWYLEFLGKHLRE